MFRDDPVLIFHFKIFLSYLAHNMLNLHLLKKDSYLKIYKVEMAHGLDWVVLVNKVSQLGYSKGEYLD
jgi:hypothetical protein